jgi:hypothetical protein
MKNRDNKSNTIDINDLIQRIHNLEIENKALKQNLRKCLQPKPTTSVKKEITTANNNNTTARDAKGNKLAIGQKVKFVTKGKYHSTEGIVESIKKNRVISIDNKKNKIVRAHNNVEIISKNGERRK